MNKKMKYLLLTLCVCIFGLMMTGCASETTTTIKVKSATKADFSMQVGFDDELLSILAMSENTTTAGIIKEIFSTNGVINQIVTSFGGEAQVWLSKKQYFRTILVSTDIWKGFGWGSIIYISALSGIDPQLYEAAALDGAGRWTDSRDHD